MLASFVSKIGIVVEDADESVYWLELIEAADIANGGPLASLIEEANELSRIFNQSQLTARTNASKRRTTQ